MINVTIKIKVCEHKEKDYDWTHDADYCVDCLDYLEPKCTDGECNYCPSRPAHYKGDEE
tara:strand:+ start:515 stop:691 length:177 start_codon:yes stop_codon:yes gene_type:complete